MLTLSLTLDIRTHTSIHTVKVKGQEEIFHENDSQKKVEDINSRPDYSKCFEGNKDYRMRHCLLQTKKEGPLTEHQSLLLSIHIG